MGAMPKPCCARSNAGTSLLLEVLFGMGLFGGVVLIVFGLFPTTHRSLTQSRRTAEAYNLARWVAERERGLAIQPSGPPDPAPELLYPNPAGADAGSTVVDGQAVQNAYNVTVVRRTINTPSGTPADERQALTVTVRWEEGTLQRQQQLEVSLPGPVPTP